MSRDNKDIKLLKRIMSVPENVIDFVRDSYNLLIDDLNIILRNMSLTNNFNSQYIKDIEIAASTTVRITHLLRTVPAYKIIVRQTGNVVITDGDFTNNYIELTNNGGSAATISIIIFKE